MNRRFNPLALQQRGVALAASCFLALGCGTLYAQGDLFATVNRTAADNTGSVFQFTSAGAQSTFDSGIIRPRGLTFDAAGDLFVASTSLDNNGIAQSTILEYAPGGSQTSFGTGDSNYFIEGLTAGSGGNIFAIAQNISDPNLATTIYRFLPNGTRSVFGSVPGQAYSAAFDNAGNLYVGDGGDRTIYKFTPGGTQSIFVGPSAFTSVQAPIGLAFDSLGNLFVSTEGNAGSDSILKFTPGGAESTFASGLTNPRGIAFDSTGNLFAAEIPASGPGDILKFTAGGMESVFASPLGNGGNGGVQFVAFEPVPEPATWVASGLIASALLIQVFRRHDRKSKSVRY
jgi:sugar lactone lactonase YvrE